MPFAAPQMAGDQLNPADIEGHTLVVIPIKFHEHVPTVHTKAGEQSPCIESYVADLSAEGGVPVVYRGVMWWNALLHGGLKRQIGETVLGRMTKGTGTTGKNPPWTLVSILGNPAEQAWLDYATSWIESAEGKAFEAEAGRQVGQSASAAGQMAPAPVPGTAVAGPPPAAPAPPAAPPAPPAVNAPPAAPPAPAAAVPAAPAGPPAATPAPAGDLASMLAALPEAERAAMMAVLANQGQAAH